MKSILFACAVLCATSHGIADETSGPNRTTIQAASWGSFFYEPTVGPSQLESSSGDYRLTTSQGLGIIQGSQPMGYRLTCGKDSLSVSSFNSGTLDIEGGTAKWSLRSENGVYTWISPQDKVVFSRNANIITIKGTKGTVIVNSQPDRVTIQSPAGTTTITTSMDKRGISGTPIAQIPYLGRGVYLTFHGLGIFVDITKLFPMPEVSEWIDWKPVL